MEGMWWVANWGAMMQTATLCWHELIGLSSLKAIRVRSGRLPVVSIALSVVVVSSSRWSNFSAPKEGVIPYGVGAATSL
jgi:hypothetical protein